VEFVLQHNPPAFLEMCLDRYKERVKGYDLIFLKRECIDGKPGKLNGLEKIEVHFRDNPFSVYMNWLEGARLAQKMIFVSGENNNKILARPKGLLSLVGVIERDVDGPEAKSSGRYTVDQFGLYFANKRVVDSMNKAKAKGTLHVAYQGLFKVPEVGDRPFYKFVRSPYEPPEGEGINETTIYIDQETWLQVGTVIKDTRGDLIAEYFFRDIRLNPDFDEKQFTRAAL